MWKHIYTSDSIIEIPPHPVGGGGSYNSMIINLSGRLRRHYNCSGWKPFAFYLYFVYDKQVINSLSLMIT